ncbi:MAG: phosphotransferase, partial [Actinomycetota bacterium]|nr:phosphotransferase [Actinomycetota bacterium]
EQYRPFVDRLAEDSAVAFLRHTELPEGAGAAAIEEFDRLCETAPARLLLHGDLNPSNVLLHGATWRIIDPKPAVGDPAFDTFSLVRDLLLDTGSREQLAELMDVAAGVAVIDPDRALRWIVMRGTLSAFWNLEDGLADAGRRDADLVLSAADLLGRSA